MEYAPVAVSLKTVPAFLGPPPAEVVPYRLPPLYMVSEPKGPAPSVMPVNVCRIVSLPLLSNLKTVPQPLNGLQFELPPPDHVVPYRLPCASIISPPNGEIPSVGVAPKLYTVV